MPNEPKVTPEEAEAVLQKLAAGGDLAAADKAQCLAVVQSLGAMVAVLDSQTRELSLTIEILESESDAMKASRAATLNALRMIAPAAASIDVDDAMTQTDTLRKKIADSNSIAQIAAAATRFAVGVASRFI